MVCHVWLISVWDLPFSEEKQGGVDCGGREVVEIIWGKEGGETVWDVIYERINFYKLEHNFNLLKIL